MIWMVVQLYRKGSPTAMPSDIGSATCLEFFRSELVRQRDLLRNVWTWYLIPMVPGYLALNVATALQFTRPYRWATLGLIDLLFAAAFIGAWKLNAYGARCLQRSIDDLDSATGSR